MIEFDSCEVSSYSFTHASILLVLLTIAIHSPRAELSNKELHHSCVIVEHCCICLLRNLKEGILYRMQLIFIHVSGNWDLGLGFVGKQSGRAAGLLARGGPAVPEQSF